MAVGHENVFHVRWGISGPLMLLASLHGWGFVCEYLHYLLCPGTSQYVFFQNFVHTLPILVGGLAKCIHCPLRNRPTVGALCVIISIISLVVLEGSQSVCIEDSAVDLVIAFWPVWKNSFLTLRPDVCFA